MVNKLDEFCHCKKKTAAIDSMCDVHWSFPSNSQKQKKDGKEERERSERTHERMNERVAEKYKEKDLEKKQRLCRLTAGQMINADDFLKRFCKANQFHVDFASIQ